MKYSGVINYQSTDVGYVRLIYRSTIEEFVLLNYLLEREISYTCQIHQKVLGELGVVPKIFELTK